MQKLASSSLLICLVFVVVLLISGVVGTRAQVLQHLRSATQIETAMPDVVASGYPLSFAPAVQYLNLGESVVGYPGPITIADANADGLPDIEVGHNISASSAVSVLLGNADGTFRRPVNYKSGGYWPGQVVVADFNRDGRPDLAIANSFGASKSCPGSLGVLFGDRWQFDRYVTYAPGSPCARPSVLAAADLNGDGYVDVVMPNRTGTLSVFLGKGDGTFYPATVMSSDLYSANSMAVADVNDDGKLDVVVTTPCFVFDCTRGAVSVLLGNGDGTFANSSKFSSGGVLADSVAIADINGDGHVDLAVANGCTATNQYGGCYGQPGVVGVLMGDGNGIFNAPVLYYSGGLMATGIAPGDMNGDGRPDLVVSNISVSQQVPGDGMAVLLNNGDGTFHQPVSYKNTGFASPTVAVADLNGDGRPDVVLTSTDTIGVFLNNSGMNESISTELASSMNPAVPGRIVTYSATLRASAGGSASPSGRVVFKDGATIIGAANVTHNGALWSTKYNEGGFHIITAVYSGDWNYGSSASPPLQEYVLSASKTSLTTSGTPSYVGQPVSFAATVTAMARTIPDGELVNFYDSSTLLGSVPLSGGRAIYITSSLAAKTHIIKATYIGDSHFVPSSAGVHQVVVNGPTASP